MPDSARQERHCQGRHPGRRGNAGRDDLGSGRARARFPGGRAAAGGSERGGRRAGNRPVQDRRSASPQGWVPRRREQRRLRGPAPRRRPLLAGDQLLNLVVDGDRRLPPGSWPWWRRREDQRWRRRSPGSLSASRRRGRRDHGERATGRCLGARAACPAGCGEHPVPAVVGDVIRDQARSASCVPVVSRKYRHADPLLPASLARERVTGFAVHNHVDHLCKTAPSLCVYWGNAGDRVAGPRP